MTQEPKLHSVLARARKIAITEERRVVVFRNLKEHWELDRYLPGCLESPIRNPFVILVNAFTGYEVITDAETIRFCFPRRIL